MAKTKPQGPRRDALGRWMPNSTGNPNGRPPKYSRIETSDLLRFKNTIIEVPTKDGLRVMTREAGVWQRLYQSAMKGDVRAQIFLLREFGKLQERRDDIQRVLERLVDKIDQDPNAKLTPAEWRYIKRATAYLEGKFTAEDGTFEEFEEARASEEQFVDERLKELLETLRRSAEKEGDDQ